MAPFKKIKTYGQTRKTAAADAEQAFNKLLALNLSKRISVTETSNSDERKCDTTFDRLLKSEFRNNVVLKPFPQNCFPLSTSSTFCDSNSNNTNEISYQPETNNSNAIKSCMKIHSCDDIRSNNNSKSVAENTSNEIVKIRPVRKFAPVQSSQSTMRTRSKIGNCVRRKADRRWETEFSGGQNEVLKKSIFLTSLQLRENGSVEDSIDEEINTEHGGNSCLGSNSYSTFKKLVDKGSTPIGASKVDMKKRKTLIPINKNSIQIDPKFYLRTKDLSVDNSKGKFHGNSSAPDSLQVVSPSIRNSIYTISNNHPGSSLGVIIDSSKNVSPEKNTNRIFKFNRRKRLTVRRESTIELNDASLIPDKEFKNVLVASTPIRRVSSTYYKQSDNSILLSGTNEGNAVNKSYEIIDRWNYKCPTQETFRMKRSHSGNVNSSRSKKNMPKIKRFIMKDSKLGRKTTVVLDANPKLNKIVKRHTEYLLNRSSILNRIKKRPSNKNLVSGKTLSKTPKKYPFVVLTPLKSSKIRSKSKNSRIHKCSKECECFRRSAKVILNRIDGFINIQRTPQIRASDINSRDLVIDLTETDDEIESISDSSSDRSLPRTPSNIFTDCVVLLEPLPAFVMEEHLNLIDSEFEESERFNNNVSKSRRKTMNEDFILLSDNDCSFVDVFSVKTIQPDNSRVTINGEQLHRSPSQLNSYVSSDCIESSIISDQMDKCISVKPGKQFRRSICHLKNLRRSSSGNSKKTLERDVNVRRTSIRVVAINGTPKKIFGFSELRR